MNLSTKLGVLLLIITLFHSCAEESGDDDDDVILPKSAISFEPRQLDWEIRDSPDTIAVKINGGNAPFHILERPAFSSTAFISNDTLYIFPNKNNNTSQIGADFINIQDNNNSISSLPILVKYDLYRFNTLTDAQLRINGDVAYNSNNFFISYAIWDKTFGTSNIGIANDTSYLELNITDIFQNGSKIIEDDDLRFTPNNRGVSFFQLNFIAKGQQQIMVDEVNSKKIKMSFNVELEERDGKNAGINFLVGSIILEE